MSREGTRTAAREESGIRQAPARAPAAEAPRDPEGASAWLRGRRLFLLLAFIVLAGAVMRAAFLDADPPLRLSWSQAPITDGSRVVESARDKIVTGRWIIDPRNPAIAHYPLSNILAWLCFLAIGVGIAQAAVPSVLAGVVSLALFARLLVRHAGALPAVLGTLFMAVNYQLIMFDRLPMSEALMISLMVSSACVFIEGVSSVRHRRGTLFLAGLLLGLGAFFVKLHALLLLPVGVLTLLAPAAPQAAPRAGGRRGDVFAFAGGLLFMAVLWAGTVLLIQPEAMKRFLYANTIGHYQYDVGDRGEKTLEATGSFLRKRVLGLFAFGVNVTFLWRMALLSITALLGLVSYLYGLPRRWREGGPFVNFMTLWLGLGIISLSLLDYRPLRYHLMLVPPICALAAVGLVGFLRGRETWTPPAPRGRVLLLLLLAGCFFGYQFIGEGGRLLVFHSQGIYRFLTTLRLDGDKIMNSVGTLTQGFLKPTLTAATVCALVFLGYLAVAQRYRAAGGITIPRERRRFLVLLVVVAAVSADLGQYANWARNAKHTLVDAGRDLAEVLTPGAMIVGSAATTLCLENRHITIPIFGNLITTGQMEVLMEYPVTHVLYRGGRLYPFLEKEHPEILKTQVFVRSYMVAGQQADLWRVPDWPGAKNRPQPYQPSTFERGLEAMNAEKYQEAAHLFEQFLVRHPDNGNACVVLAACYSELGREEDTLALFERAARLRPNDPDVLSDLGNLYLREGRDAEAEKLWVRALELKPGDDELRTRLEQLRNFGREGFDFGKSDSSDEGKEP